jgi:hypothetical protein
MSLVSDAERAHLIYEELKADVTNKHYLEHSIGCLLYRLKEKNSFKKAVGDMAWRDFLAQPEIGIPVREAEFLIGYYKLCTEHQYVIHAPEESLKFLVKTNCTSPDIIRDAEQLSVKDFKERYHEKKTNDAPKTYEFVVMRKCKETGSLTMEHTVRSAEIAEKLCLTS